jgi:diguanylate cyclase (GGDEF)-like protein
MASEWVVLLEAGRGVSSPALDRDILSGLLDAVGHAQPVGLYSPDRYAVQLHVAARDPTEALATALSAWAQALSSAGVFPSDLVRAEVITRAELDSELALAGDATELAIGPADEVVDGEFADLVAGLTTEEGSLAGQLHSDRWWRLMLAGSRETLTLISADGAVLFSFVPGRATPLVSGTGVVEAAHPDDVDAVEDALAEALASPRAPVTFIARFGGHDEWSWYESVATNLLDDPLVGAIVLNSRDVSESKRLEERIADLVERDELTGLVNRTIFLDQVELALARSTATSHVAVFFVDIDDFRGFVERHGAAVGDELLVSVAERLRSDVYDGTVAARLGGDEFALLCEGVTNSSGAAEIAKRIASALRAPVRIGPEEFEETSTIGVALGTSGMLQPATLLRNAELAMHRARRGKLHYDIYRKHRQPRSSSDAPRS